jgi:glycosyltransferase involved in cell wall biosynthesis
MKIAMIYDARDIIWWWRVHVENICKQLCTNHGCNIDLFIRKVKNKTVPLSKSIPWLNIYYYWPDTSFFNPIWRLFSLIHGSIAVIQKNKKEQYNIIHAHSYLPLLSGKIASMITKIPIIATIHGSQIMDIGKKNISYFIQKRLLTRIRYNYQICVGSNFLQYPNININIKNIGNWVNIDEFTWNKTPHNNYTILFVWRLERTKGVDILIDAINHIQTQKLTKQKFVVKIVGYWYEEDKYKELVNKKNLNHLISFEWQKIWKELIKYYKSSDLMVVPSRAEWFWIIILEAMAAW